MTQARILRQASILFASNLRNSIDYWADRLGFERHGIFGDPPEFAIVKRDNCFVMLRQAAVDQKIVPYWQLNSGLWNAYFWVDDVTALFEEVSGRSATIDYGLCDQPYDVREFGVRDPDEQDIGFGQVLD